jgi:hypothetical protein
VDQQAGGAFASEVNPRKELIAQGILITLGFVLRLAFVNAADLWSDEAVSWAVSSGPLLGLGDRVAASEAKPPLYFAALHFWMGLFGDSEASMRTLSALFWPPFALMMAAIGRRCCGRWSLFALGLAAVSPLLVYYGVEARPYAMLLCAETGFALLILKMLESDAPALRVWLAVSSFCIVSLQFTGLFFILPILGFYVFQKRQDRREFLRTLAPQAAAAVVFAAMLAIVSPGVFSTFGQLEGGWWAPAPSIVQVVSAPIRLLAPVSSWHFYTDFSKPLNILLFVGAAGLGALWIHGLAISPKRGYLIATTLGVIGLLVAYSVTRANLLFPRYYIGCAPLLLIAIAASAERKGRILAPAAALAQIALLVALPPFARVPEYRKAVDLILSRESGPVTILSGGWDTPAVRYYARHARDRVVLRESPASVEASTFYLLESSAWKDKSGMMDALRWTSTFAADVGGVTVYRVTK